MTPRRATVIGSGPNGLAAAVALARAGFAVTVIEAQDAPGGGCRTAPLTLTGFRHDTCSAVHPAAFSSEFLRAFGLRERVSFAVPEISYAQVLDADRAAIAWRDLDRTADALGPDAHRWRRLLGPLTRSLDDLVALTADPRSAPRHPLLAAGFARRVARLGLGSGPLRTEEARALLGGVIAHANTRLPSLAAAATGLFLAAHGHAEGWGLPIGGAGAISDALLADLTDHGGQVVTGTLVSDLGALDWGDPARGDVLLLDAAPRLALTLPGVPAGWARAIRRYSYGPGAAKLDLALEGEVPWRNPVLSQAVTVHLGGTWAEMRDSENLVAHGRLSRTPYVLLVQPGVVDASRAPTGASTVWAYLHVPTGSTLDASGIILDRIEKFAPGFRERILAMHSTTAADLGRQNPSAIGGDFAAGAITLRQLLARPVGSRSPWRTPIPGVYLASAATPPGPGVHGTAGWHAARCAIEDVTGEALSPAELFATSGHA